MLRIKATIFVLTPLVFFMLAPFTAARLDISRISSTASLSPLSYQKESATDQPIYALAKTLADLKDTKIGVILFRGIFYEDRWKGFQIDWQTEPIADDPLGIRGKLKSYFDKLGLNIVQLDTCSERRARDVGAFLVFGYVWRESDYLGRPSVLGVTILNKRGEKKRIVDLKWAGLLPSKLQPSAMPREIIADRIPLSSVPKEFFANLLLLAAKASGGPQGTPKALDELQPVAEVLLALIWSDFWTTFEQALASGDASRNLKTDNIAWPSLPPLCQ